MMFDKITKRAEIKFWDAITPIMAVGGPILRIRKAIYHVLHTKPGFVIILAVLWGAVGFLSGLLIGKVVGFFPLH
ncbi:MAG: hypothetical protein SVR81_00140 [Chloroflexota bacterium]|nr:hypothetical protein [Chloroflexota bacterium]